MDKSTRRQTEERVVSITEVNLVNNQIIAHDEFNTTLYLSLNFHQPILVIPSVGEVWLVKRKGFDWYLESRSENGDEEVPIRNLKAGDTRIQSDGILYINAPRIVRNGLQETYNALSPVDDPETVLEQWNIGDKVWNSNPTTGAPLGWIYTKEGWLAFAKIPVPTVSITKTFEIPNLIVSASSTFTGTSYVTITPSIIFDKSQFSVIDQTVFRAELVQTAVGTFSVFAQLINLTDNLVVPNSELTVLLAQNSTAILTSTNLNSDIANLPKKYAVQVKVGAGGTGAVNNASLIARLRN